MPQPPDGRPSQCSPEQAARRERTRLHRTEHPGVYRRGEKFVLIWRHQGRQHKKTYSALAEALAAQAEHRAGETRPGGRSGLILRHYARDWVESYAGHTQRGITDHTRESYRYSLERYAIPQLGSRDIRTLRPRDIRGFVADIESRGLKPSSVERHLAPLKALLATAYDDGDIERDPARRVRVSGRNRPKEATSARALTADEIHRLLAELQPPWDLLVEFLIHTGLRISEAIALTWADLDLDERACVRVRKRWYRGDLGQPKSHAGIRNVPLSRNMAVTLDRARTTSNADDSDLVFPSDQGKHLDPHNLRARVIRPAADAAGLQNVSPRTFRHTCASQLFSAGRNVKQVQEWLGHHDAAVTLRVYIHLVDKGVGDAEFFDDLTRTGPSNDGQRNSVTAGSPPGPSPSP